MRVRAEGGVARARQELSERRVARQVAAQNQRVDEQPDERFRLDQVPPRDRRADQHALLAGVTEQERLEAGQKRHEQRHALPPTEVPERFGEILRKGEGAVRAAIGLHRRPRTVGRQVEGRGGAGQLFLPILQLAAQHVALQPLPLPRREVDVLEFRPGQRRPAVVAERLVAARQLAQEHVHRPAVADDVVRRQEEDVVFGTETQE